MLLSEFAFYGLLLLIGAPFILLWAVNRTRYTGSLVMREAFTREASGVLVGGTSQLDPQTRTLTVKTPEGETRLPFEAIQGLRLEIGTSRKIHLYALCDPDQAGGQTRLELGVVSNSDLKQAGINAHQVLELVAGAEEAQNFLDALQAHRWTGRVLGAAFEYHLAKNAKTGVQAALTSA
jgi:hypothetical protein